MRTESEMMNSILNFAKSNEKIRAVWLNGSRANNNIEKDDFQDYDIVYVVDDTSRFIEDKSWIDYFGKTIIIQEPDDIDRNLGEDLDFSHHYMFLILFKDGNRIDFKFLNKAYAVDEYKHDSLTVLLLDKDNFLPSSSDPSDLDYWVKKTSEAEFKACQSEFWWCLQNISKGIMRDELTFAMRMYQIAHEELEKMTNWYIGINTGFTTSVGKFGKYYKKYLPNEIYELYIKTYSDSDYENLWNAMFSSCELFQIFSKHVSNNLDFEFDLSIGDKVVEYIQRIRDTVR
ncbi:MAG: aminoglycoside 6-adenylyltransferase [Clostridioides sp.]|jgi:aminoglycoside 6-adenylyltransferase|nr:aminoglycoside 6-adenylyltransferase [Clostridioides sp.]